MKKSMRARAFLHALSVLSLACSSVSGQTAQPDILVTATRSPTKLNEALRDVSVFNREDIEKSGATTLVELLATVPGIQVSPETVRGAVPSLFIRGTNSNHSLFLVDGQRVSSATTGATAFQNLPLEQIERVEILRGPSSSLYGADALGGVVQVFTRSGSAGAPAPNAYLSVGQYGTSIASVGYGGRVEDSSFYIQAGQEKTKGFSEIKASKTGLYDTYNADRDGYRQGNFGLKLNQRISSSLEAGMNYFYSEGTKHSDNANCGGNWPAQVCTTNFDNRDMHSLSNGTVNLTWKADPVWASTFRVGQSKDDSESREFDPTTRIVTSPKYSTTQDQITWQNDFDLDIGKFVLALESRNAKVKSAKELDVNSQRTESTVFGYQGRNGNHQFQASLRQDRVSALSPESTSSVGYGYKLTNELVARASVGTAFHAPSFNDLYWPVDPVNFYQGNPNLKPERSLNRELGLGYESLQRSAGITFYQNTVKDLIAIYEVDANTGMSSVGNIGMADIKGATIHFHQRYLNWSAKFAYDVLSAKDRATQHYLARRAPRSGSLDLERIDGPLRTVLRVQSVSARFNDSLNKQELNGYALLSLRTSYAVDKAWRLEANINNLTNKDYVVIRSTMTPYNDYSTAGRSLYLGARYTPK